MNINSKENKIYKLCLKLASKKYRDSLGLYLIEGPNLILEAFENESSLEFIIINEKKISEYGKFNMPKGIEAHFMEQKLFDKIAITETSQGIIGVARKNTFISDEEFFRVLPKGANLIVLDRLQDPGNIGTIIRTAEGAGYAGIISLVGTGDIYGPKVIRAAAGSVFRMPVLFLDSPAHVISLLKKYGKRITATCLEGEKYYYSVDLKKDIGLIIGNEGGGICEELVSQADLKIKIPMEGKIESLNAAIAAGIIMYEAMRK